MTLSVKTFIEKVCIGFKGSLISIKRSSINYLESFKLILEYTIFKVLVKVNGIIKVCDSRTGGDTVSSSLS